MPSTIIILIAWDLYGLKALSLLAGLMLVLILMVCIRFWRIKGKPPVKYVLQNTKN